MQKIIRLRLLVSGTVQGVGFRWFAKHTARLLNLTGFAENRPDGSVLVEAQGQLQSVEDFVTRIRDGRGFIEVTDITRCEIALQDESEFQTR